MSQDKNTRSKPTFGEKTRAFISERLDTFADTYTITSDKWDVYEMVRITRIRDTGASFVDLRLDVFVALVNGVASKTNIQFEK